MAFAFLSCRRTAWTLDPATASGWGQGRLQRGATRPLGLKEPIKDPLTRGMQEQPQPEPWGRTCRESWRPDCGAVLSQT